jgi:ABC-2 type transport system permease protein
MDAEISNKSITRTIKNSVRRNAKLYLLALKNSIAARITYRADFIFSSFMILVAELVIPVITLLIYKTGASFPGWSVNEVLLLQGVFMAARGFAGLLFFGLVWNTLDRVREGTYDILLIKPASTLFLSIATSFESDSIGVIISGTAVSAFALARLPGSGFANILIFIVLFVLSLVVLFSFALMMAGSVFKWVGNSRIYEIFDSIVSFGNYPRTIFSKAFQTIISYILPISLIGFLPASVLLGKNMVGLPGSAAACLVFLGIGLTFWKVMLKKYTSAGG